MVGPSEASNTPIVGCRHSDEIRGHTCDGVFRGYRMADERDLQVTAQQIAGRAERQRANGLSQRRYKKEHSGASAKTAEQAVK